MGLADHPELAQGLAAVRAELEQRLDSLRTEVRRVEVELDNVNRLIAPPAKVLSGDSLRAALHEILKEKDPGQAGVHYQELSQALRGRGFLVSGKSQDKA